MDEPIASSLVVLWRGLAPAVRHSHSPHPPQHLTAASRFSPKPLFPPAPARSLLRAFTPPPFASLVTYGPVPRETALLAQSTPAPATATRSLSPGPLCTLSTARSLCPSLAELNRPPASSIQSIALHCPHPLPHASHHVSVPPASSQALDPALLPTRSSQPAGCSSQFAAHPPPSPQLQPLPATTADLLRRF